MNEISYKDENRFGDKGNFEGKGKFNDNNMNRPEEKRF